jgi:hypothetical protein
MMEPTVNCEHQIGAHDHSRNICVACWIWLQNVNTDSLRCLKI